MPELSADVFRTIALVGGATAAAFATYMYLLPNLRSKINGVPVTCGLPGIDADYHGRLHEMFVVTYEKTVRMGRVYGSYFFNPFKISAVTVSHPKVLRQVTKHKARFIRIEGQTDHYD